MTLSPRDVRYAADLKLVEAIGNIPLISAGIRLNGLRSPTEEERRDLLGMRQRPHRAVQP